MFVQVISGKVADAELAHALVERWVRDLSPTAVGWQGGTFGVSDDGIMVAVNRFSSEAAARRNSARPEQTAFFEEMKKAFVGPITFHDCEDVSVLVDGSADEASFVQVIQGRVKDIDRAHKVIEQSGSLIAQYRPDVIGATVAIDADGFLTETVAFRSEAEARRAEKAPLPPEVHALLAEEMALLDNAAFIDLHQPWFAGQTR